MAKKLRGAEPEQAATRIKALLVSAAGIGKTTAAIQMPRPYIIDCERGTVHYGDVIKERGGAVLHTTSMDEVIEEVRVLASTDHDYRTLVIDPFTPLYDTELEVGESKVGSDFGRHYGYAQKGCKRLYNLCSQLDMNVIFTAHNKRQYGDQMKVIGDTFDGWKKLDFLFDLVFFLERDATGRRIATVGKTRLTKQFPDQSKFEWSFDNLAERYGREKLEAKAKAVSLADPALVAQFEGLLAKLSEDDRKALKIDRALKEYESIADMPAERIAKGVEIITKHLDRPAPAAV